MANKLANENSPYLIQHADNPVDWYPWGQEALARAVSENKPIFLSIGYAACHWCHVMAHESFEDPATAAIMNQHFVNIKVDREERPDLDGIYMSAVVAMTGHGGWPMSVFLTPELVPFYGGTYFPPVRRFQMPSFQEVLLAVARTWREDQPGIRESGRGLAQHLQQNAALAANDAEFTPAHLEQAALNLAQSYDWKHGGWGQAPKFPQPMTVEFLLRRATQADKTARDMAVHALRSMAKGGMYDVVGGGFARYSTDDRWLVPHFEKMLYDNAQLALAYLHGWLVTGDAQFRQVCTETLDFVVREMTSGEGGFYSSLDADSEGEEGKFYVWTADEMRQVLGQEEAEFAIAAYAVSQQGNFEGQTVLQRALDDDALAQRFGLPAESIQPRLAACHANLLAARAGRVRPGTDDKILSAWNGLMLAAFAEAGRYLNRPDYLAAAQHNAAFLLDHLYVQGRLLRSWRRGQAKHNAYLEDYAALVLGLLALYQADPDVRWFSAARRLADEMVTHFRDPAGGFFDTRDDHEALLNRPKEVQDNATPSGGALAAEALLLLAAYTGRSEWRDQAESALRQVQPAAARYPTAFARWLGAASFALAPVQEIAILGNPADPRTQALVQQANATYRPYSVLAQADFPPAPGAPELLHDRPLHNAAPTAYVCQHFACQQPVTAPEDLQALLG